MTVPSTIEIRVAHSPTKSEMRDPQIRSVRIERPSASVPSQ